MKILALEASSLVASVAILDTEEEIITAEYTMNYKVTHSQTLLPMIDEVCRRVEMEPEQLDAIAVAAGPGSFTGLRIGSATAKGLGFALNLPIISVPTLEAMAMNACGCGSLVCPIMDARRNQTYTGIYSFEGTNMETVLGQTAVSIDELIERINEIGKPVLFIGDGIPVFKPVLDEQLTVPHYFAPAGMNRQRASSVAVLGARMAQKGEMISAKDHLPDYLRIPQAERERMEREKASQTEA